MKKISKAMLLAVAAVALVTSCADSDVYDPNAALAETTAEYEANWEDQFGAIASDQDWNMAESVTATMTIYEDALANYYLQLYTADPLHTDSAYLLASYAVTTDGNGYATTTFNVDIPAGLTQLYACRKNAKSQCSVRPITVEDNTITVTFGQSTTRGITRTSTAEYPIPEYSATIKTNDEVDAYIAGMYQLDWDVSMWNYYWDSSANKGYPEYTKYLEANADSSLAIILKDGDVFPYFSGYYNTDIYTDFSGCMVDLKELVFVIESGTVTCENPQAINFGSEYVGSVETIKVFIKDGATLSLVGNGGGQVAFGEAYVYNLEGGTISGVGLSVGNSAYGNTIDYCLWNAGTIEVSAMYMSYAYVDNVGSITVNGNIQESINSRLINNGYVYCESFGDGSNQDSEVWTNCKFICTDYCKGSNFRIGCNASISAPDIEVYGQIDLNADAILYASSQLLMGNCDINGPTTTGDHALIQSPSLYYFCNTDDPITIIGNINFYYDSMTRSEAIYWDNVIKTYFETNIDAGYDSNLSNTASSVINLNYPTDCAVGSIDGGDDLTGTEEEEEETPVIWTIVAEDLGSTDDYDFNDVIFSVSYVAGQTVAYVTPRAAGGVYEATVNYNGTALFEIHEALANSSDQVYVDDYDLPMINTATGGEAGETIEITVPEDFSLAEDMGGFSVTVQGETVSVTITAPTEGTAPQMILLSGEWQWPVERYKIKTTYPNFSEWNADTNAIDWATTIVGTVLGNY